MIRGTAWRHVLAGALLTGLALAAISCRQILGIGDREGGGFVYVSAECESCVASACSAEEAACLAEEACAARGRCLAGCAADDLGCRQPCVAQTAPTAVSVALEDCRSQHCYSVCDACAASVFDPRGAECSACMMADCCEPSTACAEQPDCGSALRTWLRCADPVCTWAPEDAVVATPAGSAVEQCFKHCLAACHFGSDWSCVDVYELPEPTAPTLNAQFELYDGIYNVGANGLVLKGCLDDTCTDPLPAAGPTVDGHTEIELPAPFVGHIWLKHDDYFEEHVYLGDPIVGDTHYWIPLLPSALQGALEAMLGATLAPDRGLVLVTAFDCFNDWGIGATIEVSTADELTVRGYFDGVTLTTEDSGTIDMGSALFINVPEGPAMITVRSPSGEAVATSTAFVRNSLQGTQLTRIWAYPWHVD